MNDKEALENFFDEHFDQIAGSHAYRQNSEASWEKIRPELKKLARRSRRRHRFALVSVVAAAFIIGAVAFGNPAVSKALYTPIYESVKVVKDGVVNLIFGNQDQLEPSGAKTSPPPTYHADQLEISDLERPAFQTVPEGYVLADEKAVSEGKMRYTFRNGEHFVIVNLSLLKTNSAVVTNGTDDVETVAIDAFTTGYLMMQDNGFIELQFMTSDIHVMIFGQITKEDIVAFAQGMY